MKKRNVMKLVLDLTVKIVMPTILLISASACSDHDDEPTGIEIPATAPTENWSATLKGNGEELGAYPDLYSNYWEYTYRVDENEDKILCFKGQYPYSRYFSFSIYNDETGDAIGGRDDVDVDPDAGSVNPFLKTVQGKNFFTFYIVPSQVDKETLSKLGTRNYYQMKEGVKKAAVCLRHYLGTTADGTLMDEFAGVALPRIVALDIHTLQPVVPPTHEVSNIYRVTSKVFSQKSDENKQVSFFLAPVSRYYPNNSTDYLYARTHLQTDSVLVFSFIPAVAPSCPEEYGSAQARYWSICLGSAGDTRSYYSVCDHNALASPGKKSTFVVCLKKNPRLAEIQAKVDRLNAAGGLVNLFVWDSEKQNIDGKPLGEFIVLMYRNILPNKDWTYSISKMMPTNYKDATGEPIDHVTEPEHQLAHLALGDYGPLGEKWSTAEYLDADR